MSMAQSDSDSSTNTADPELAYTRVLNASRHKVDAYSHSNSNTDPMHGEVCPDTKAASYPATAPVAAYGARPEQ